MNALHDFLELILPYAISVFEIIGVLVVCWSGLHVFLQFFENTFLRKKFDLQTNLAKGLAIGLEFKMAAEILKTVLIQTLEEIYILGAVILLRALLSLLIHFEIGPHGKEKNEADQAITDEK